MKPSDTDRIEKRVTLKAPRARVWRAIANYEEFGAWFRVDLESPFVPGATVRGRKTHPEYAGLPMALHIERVEPETLLSYRWHPYAIDPKQDYSQEPMTLVELRLADAEGGGTLLTIVESGFDALPPARRAAALRSNTQGWDIQAGRVADYVAQG